MKKIFTTLFIVLGFYTASFAQHKGDIEFGANVGYNGAYVTESGSNQNSDIVSGFNAGVSIDSYFSDRWSIKAKVSYDQKGWGNGFLITPSGAQFNSVDFKLNYITIPVMANWHFGRQRNWYLNFGPYVGILTSASAANTGYNDLKNSFNSTDVGIDLGIGVKFPISDKAKMFLEYDGQGGFTNIFKETSDGSTIQNLRESFNIGISFSVN